MGVEHRDRVRSHGVVGGVPLRLDRFENADDYRLAAEIHGKGLLAAARERSRPGLVRGFLGRRPPNRLRRRDRAPSWPQKQANREQGPISYIPFRQHQQGREVHAPRLNLNVYIVNLWSIIVAKGTTMSALSSAAATMGRKGGKSKSPAKVRAVRENGKLGGRPPKKAAA